MALAKGAGIEEPKPFSLFTRREIDEWILPHITRNDTMNSVLERYIFLSIHLLYILSQFLAKCLHVFHSKLFILQFCRVFEGFDKRMLHLKRDRIYLEESFVTFLLTPNMNFNSVENYIKIRHL